MKYLSAFLILSGLLFYSCGGEEMQFEKDIVPTASGKLEITFIGHGSLLFQFAGKNIYVDPFSRLADYSKFPRAELVLITHQHRDHLDPEALEKISTEGTIVVCTEKCFAELGRGIVMHNGDEKEISGLKIRAVPAYNIVHKRENGQPFHPKGEGNGYVVTFGDKKVYIAGDTEDIAEMEELKEIEIAFLPMNLPYTMTPEMTANAALSFSPKILYPYHYGDTDPQKLVNLLKGNKEIEVRIREMR